MSNIEILDLAIRTVIIQYHRTAKKAYKSFMRDIHQAKEARCETAVILLDSWQRGGWKYVLKTLEHIEYTDGLHIHTWEPKVMEFLKVKADLAVLKKKQAIILQNCQMQDALKEALNK